MQKCAKKRKEKEKNFFDERQLLCTEKKDLFII